MFQEYVQCNLNRITKVANELTECGARGRAFCGLLPFVLLEPAFTPDASCTVSKSMHIFSGFLDDFRIFIAVYWQLFRTVT